VEWYTESKGGMKKDVGAEIKWKQKNYGGLDVYVFSLSVFGKLGMC